jgi:hypothetical protein
MAFNDKRAGLRVSNFFNLKSDDALLKTIGHLDPNVKGDVDVYNIIVGILKDRGVKYD